MTHITQGVRLQGTVETTQSVRLPYIREVDRKSPPGFSRTPSLASRPPLSPQLIVKTCIANYGQSVPDTTLVCVETNGNISSIYTQQYHRRRLGTPLPPKQRALAALWGFSYTFFSTNIPHSCRPIQIGIPYSCLHFPDTIRDCHLLPRFQSPRVKRLLVS